MEHYATAQQVYAAGLVFARLGAIVMLLPGIGENFVPGRVRLGFAFLFALVIYPIVGPGAPPVPVAVSDVGGQIIKEVLIGLMMGAILRMFMASLTVAGELVSMQTTLAFAQTANPTQAAPTTSLGTLLAMIGVLLVMTTDLHHLFLGAIVKSYSVFPFRRPVPINDAGQLAIQTVSRAFALGLQLSAPVMVFSVVFSVATGLVARVMPQFQVFFVAAPLQVLLGLSVFALSLGSLGMVWLDRYRQLLIPFGG